MHRYRGHDKKIETGAVFNNLVFNKQPHVLKRETDIFFTHTYDYIIESCIITCQTEIFRHVTFSINKRSH